MGAMHGEREGRNGVRDGREVLHRQLSHDSTGRVGDVQKRTDHAH